MLNVDMDDLTRTPCVDGTILNVDRAGCDVFYWGMQHDGQLIKFRCTSSEENNFYTESSFYVMSNDSSAIADDWTMFCVDFYTKIFVITDEKLEDQQENEK